METHPGHNFFERRSFSRTKASPVKWVKEWVTQDVIATGGKCLLYKWVPENTVKTIKDRPKEVEVLEPEPEPTTEVLFLCSYEGCGKTFIDAGALRKHSHIHGERQYVCQWEQDGKVCGKKFLDSSKLKRHCLTHTGERDFVCPHEGCGKAFSLDFNLRSHMKTHSQENYHICPYADCGKRYAHEYKLKNHISSHHEKNNNNNNHIEVQRYAQPQEKIPKASKPSASAYGSGSSDRPYGCPYDGCGKCYIHEYKLNLHLRREHPGHFSDENAKNPNGNDIDEGSDQDAYVARRGSSSKAQKQSKSKPNMKLPPAKVARKGSTPSPSPANLGVVKKPWPVKEEKYEDDDDEEDSEETEEDRDNVDDGWRYAGNNEDDDEETEDED